jgi:hypothetical protein
MQSLPVFSGPLPVVSSGLALPTYNFTEGVKVEIRIEGTVTVVSDERAPYVNSPLRVLDARGVMVYGVYNTCYVSAYVSYPTSPGPRSEFGPGGGCTGIYETRNYVDTGLVRGAGTAVRKPKIPEESVPCDTIVCHIYDGSQTVTIRPLEADLDFKATFGGVRRDHHFVPRFSGSVGYHTIIFTDSTLPRGMPLQPLNHSWFYADPTDPGHPYWHKTDINQCPNYSPPLYPSAYCAINIKEAGMMTSRTRVNGVEHTDSVTIYCIETEPLLNSDMVRQQLLALLVSSHANDSDPANRVERRFLILKDTVTPGSAPYLYFFPRDPSASVCNTGPQTLPDIPLPWPNRKVLAHGHDHLSEPNISVQCTDSTGMTYVAKTVDGASTDDWEFTNLVNNPAQNPTYQQIGWLPMSGFIIDKHNVFVMRPGQSAGSEHQTGNKFRWDKGLCAWPKRSV